jgi:crotonobetainyl-CoA:carnitine CoA-transferase CaiB-like acyl-CoA transferase
VAISIDSEINWKNLKQAMAEPDWAMDTNLQTLKGRFARKQEIDKKLAEWTLQFNREEIVETLQAHGIAAVPVLSMEEQYTDKHYEYRRIHEEVVHPLLGKEFLFNVPWKLSKTPGAILRSAPFLGEHDNYVYETVLGLSKEDLTRLQEEKVIY